MRNLTLLLLSVPSFVTSLAAQDMPLMEAQYKKLAIRQVCMKECDTVYLQQQSSSSPDSRALRKLSTCQLTCNDEFNRTGKAATPRSDTLVHVAQ
jgi:hypothetical protein